ncbi:glycoside hydrolase superfamily [Kalaharituber pfeilii]|nr:glycoside hydrolase superfamily [Kalaharituber pfeilii]
MFSKGISALTITFLLMLQLASASPVRQRNTNAPGIVYSPYKGVPGNTACKTPEEVANDIERLKNYGMIRLYGLDCDQVKNVLPQARKHQMNLFIGIFEVDQLDQQVNQLANIVAGDWSNIDTVSVGNECILSGKKTAEQMVALTREARAKLRAKGFNGSVVSVNIFYEVLQNPILCQEQDYIATNAHPFFDGNVTPDRAGPFLEEMRKQVSKTCGGARVLITETGWPSQGATNGVAVPSKENQKIALDSIRNSLHNDVIIFTAFDDTWKADNPSTFNAEKHWGVL